MGAVKDKQKELIAVIRESNRYQRFERAKEAIADHPEKKIAIDEFRRRCFTLSNTREPVGDMLSEMKELFNERERVYEDPLVREYLTAEVDLCRMLQRICTDVVSVIDLQIDPFEDIIENAN